ncbi:putative glucose na cotransporter [Vairimorpha apis BRL 01]|uniref:Putative glucose na cotransporter n=1 Tax=Vairimorpha apis BRL 01 TaxID=1037528 RepID=T0MEW4_9MICR|nr:putative glucose na cotransporter [Vairimorpha apis BRL 01]
MIVTDYICSQIDLPLCNFISDNVCKTSSRSEYILDLKIYSPAFVGLLLSNIALTLKMIQHVKDLCSSIAFTFFMLSVVFLVVGSHLIAILTDKYLDNLFFYNLFVFCAVVMVHKFWLSVCDYEVECLLLEV